jgi:hypothetical protein
VELEMMKCEDCSQHPVVSEKMTQIENKLHTHDLTLYGEKEDGLTYKIKGCLTWKSFLVLVGLVAAVALKMWADTRNLPETVKDVGDQKISIVKIEKDIEREKEKIVKLEKYLETQKEQSAKIDAIYSAIVKDKQNN